MALSTSQKIGIARVLSFCVRTMRALFGMKDEVRVTRRNICWALNLREGIDLSIYMLGGFEVATLNMYEKSIHKDDIVLDIGANIGAHTLVLAQIVGENGKVLAFEPTDYAFGKLMTNLSLNPELSRRVDARQIMLVSDLNKDIPSEVYSSWPLDAVKDLNEQHLGRLMPVAGAQRAVLDDLIKECQLSRIDWIKLDVDGNELSVLKGADYCLRTFKPRIIMELAPYVYGERPEEFEELIALLVKAGYTLSEISSGRRLPLSAHEIKRCIPDGGGINVLAIAQSPEQINN